MTPTNKKLTQILASKYRVYESGGEEVVEMPVSWRIMNSVTKSMNFGA